MQAPENTNPERQNNRGPIEKIILIETCRECKSHRSSTWHDETKYENNFKLVQTAINTLTPGVEVIRKMDGPINLGAFEIKHGDQLIYSKKNTGLWPNPKAVAQRVKSYFEDLEAGKNVANYGKQKEVAYVPKRVPGEVRASTSAGFRTNKLDAKSNTQASAKNLTPSKQTKIDSAGGSPDEGNLEGDHEDKVKHDEEEQHHHHHHEQKSQTPEHQHHAEGSDREAHHEGGPTHHEEHKEEQNKPQSGQATPKEEHDAPAPTHSHENKAHEEHKEPGSAQTKEEPHSAAKGSEPQSAAKSNEPHSAALGSEPHSAGAKGSEPQSAGAKGSEPQSAAKSNEPNSAAVSTPKENKDEKKGEEYPEDFS